MKKRFDLRRGVLALLLANTLTWISHPALAANGHLKGMAVANSGAVLAGGIVELTDSSSPSKTLNAAINAKGKFSFKTGGMTPPFLLKATAKDASVTLYGFALGDGTANADVYTDLIVSMVYAALSTDSNTQFSAGMPVPSGLMASSFGNDLSLTSTTVQNLITSWLVADKVKTTNFNFLNNKFAANNAKFGKLSHQTSIKTPLASGVEVIEITDGNTVQDITFTGDTPAQISSLTGLVSGNSSTTVGSANPITTALSTSIMVSDEQAAEFDAVNAVLKSYQGIINSKGKKLAATDLQSPLLFSQSYLRGGEDLATATADLVTGLRGQKLSNIGITGINSIVNDPSSGFNDLNVIYTYQSKKLTSEPITEVFQCPDPIGSGACVFWGNQQLAQTQNAVQLSMLTNATLATPNPVPAPALGIDVLAPIGSLSAVSANDATHVFFNDDPVALTDQVTQSFFPTAGGQPLVYNQDEFRLVLGTLPSIPPAGMDFTIAVTPTGGSPQAPYITSLSGSPGEPINLIQPSLTNGSHAFSAAPIGQAATIKWGLPTSYPVQSISLTGQVIAACGVAKQIAPTKTVTAKSTSATIQFPSQVSAPGDIQEIDINLGILGVNGAVSRLVYAYGQCS